MMGQIFKKSDLIKKINIKIWKKLYKLKFNNKILKNLKIFDKKDILIKNFIYLLRLNNLNEKEYFNNINLIKLFIVYYNMKYICNDNVEKEKKQILKIIKNLKNKIFINYFNNNYEKIIFFKKDINNSKTKIYYNFNLLYNFIANVFYQPFINIMNYKLYFSYGYYLIFLINLIVIKKILNDINNIEIYKIKLNVMFNCHILIGKITPLYFNNFIQQINFFLKKY